MKLITKCYQEHEAYNKHNHSEVRVEIFHVHVVALKCFIEESSLSNHVIFQRSNSVNDGGGYTGGHGGSFLLQVLRHNEPHVCSRGAQDEVGNLLDAHPIDVVLVNLMNNVPDLQLPAACRTSLNITR